MATTPAQAKLSSPEPFFVHLAHYRPEIQHLKTIGPRFNYNWQILYPLTEHSFSCRKGWINSRSGCLYVIPPRFPYYLDMKTYRHYSCHFSAERYRGYESLRTAHSQADRKGWRDKPLASNPVTMRIENAQWHLVNPMANRGRVEPPIQDLIQRYRNEDHYGARVALYRLLQTLAGPPPVNQASLRIQAFMDYLTRSIHEPRSIAELAEACRLSRSQLNRLCRQVYGHPAKEMVLREKIDLAEVLLGRGVPVHETARACGFEDPYYFSRLFRKRKGVPPSAVPEDRSGAF